MNRLIAFASLAALLLGIAALAGALWLKSAEELPRHLRLNSSSSSVSETGTDDPDVYDFLPAPIVSPNLAVEPSPIRRYSGRWLGAFEANLFQPDGTGEVFWLSGNTEEIWLLYKSRVTQPQREAAKDGFTLPSTLPNHLCLNVDLIGVLIRPESGQKIIGGFNVHRILRADPVDVPEDECLNLPF